MRPLQHISYRVVPLLLEKFIIFLKKCVVHGTHIYKRIYIDIYGLRA